MYDSAPAPSWDEFRSRFWQHFAGQHRVCLQAMDGTRLFRTLGRMRSKSAAGCDGWRAEELKRLPIPLLDRLATMFTAIERTGVWPRALTVGIVSLISKGEGTSPLKLRPIGIMSVVYRLWAATRVAEVLAWQEKWLDKGLYGFRRSHGADDVWWEQSLHVERALTECGDLFGISLDYGKCFDRVPVHIVLELASASGMPPQLVTPLQSLYANLVRRFRVGRGVGQEFRATNGIIQGCPLSVVLLNLLVNVWARAVGTEVPKACPTGYADDTGATSAELGSIQQVLDVTGHFATVTGQVLNASKSCCWSTCGAGRRELSSLTLQGEPVPATTGGRLLGAHVSYQMGVRNTLGEERSKKGVAVCERVRWAPLPMHVRAKLIASLVLPSSLYGFCVSGLSRALLDSSTSAVMRALWGTTRKLRSKDLVLSLLVPGHLVDPRQASVYQCLRTFRRFMRKRPDLHHVVACLWHTHGQGRACAPGPVSQVFKAVAALGWHWASVDSFSRPGRRDLLVQGGPDAWWDHELRDGLRLARWAEAARSRSDMQGLEAVQGLDRSASLALLQKCGGRELGVMRAILVGSVRLQKRLFEASIAESPTCQFCGLADETLGHCFWDCTCWAALRSEFDVPADSLRAQWPACTRECGLFLEDVRVPALSQQLADEEPILANFAAHFDLASCRSAIASNAPLRPQTVWTDGACAHNQDDRFRRAGSGIFYGLGHELNWCGMLPGLLQSNQRAELFAVLVACLRDPRPLDIRSDSEWVCNGVSSWREWADTGWPGEHADLWNLLAHELGSRETIATVTWVKGHATDLDVARGRTTVEDKKGNDGADELAVAGASKHRVPAEVVKAARARRKAAIETHRMMLAILSARQAAEHEASQDADRGSEMGDGIFDLDDDSAREHAS